MELLNFENNALLLNLGLFAVAAVIIWFAGTRVAFVADAISDRTSLGKAFMGLLFLAVATELPEVGTTVSASLDGNAELAVNNIFGGVTLQTAVLAIVDLVLIRGALTFFVPRPVLILQSVLLILLLGMALAAITVGELVSLFNIGLWSLLLFLAYAASLYLSQQYEGSEQWTAENPPGDAEKYDVIDMPSDPATARALAERSMNRLVLTFVGLGGVILVVGFLMARLAEALAEQTGLGSSFVGATLLAASTSLPELSTSLAAVRLGNYELAFANIFGSNSIMMVLLFISDIFYREGPILNAVTPSATFTAAVGIVVTAVYTVGMLERQNRTVLRRLGVDSAIVLAVYLGSLVVLYQLR